jgi:protein-tyrosine phosphatase
MGQNARADHSDPTLITVPARQVIGELANLLTLRERSDTLVADDLKPGFVEMAYIARVLWARAAGKAGLGLLALPPVRRLHAARARRALRRARSVLFVCKGNICRSPFAQRYARSLLPDSVVVMSCGYYPRQGRVSPDDAVAAAGALGVDLATHRSAVLSETMARDAEVIFVFDEEDLRTVRTRFPFAAGRIHLLGLVAPGKTLAIMDPYGQGRDVFDGVYRRIADALKMSVVSRDDTAASLLVPPFPPRPS